MSPAVDVVTHVVILATQFAELIVLESLLSPTPATYTLYCVATIPRNPNRTAFKGDVTQCRNWPQKADMLYLYLYL